MQDFQRQFIRFAVQKQVLRFGIFHTKSGRSSPYFYDSGRFRDGASLLQLARYYTAAIQHHGLLNTFDILYGPAYKGIPLVAATAITLHQETGQAIGWCFNRKEEKDHGEGGTTVGSPLQGRVLILDDVITAGLSVQQSCRIIRHKQAKPCAAIVALDREERGSGGTQSAIAELAQDCGIPIFSIISTRHIIDYLGEDPKLHTQRQAIQNHLERWGASTAS